MGQLHVEFQYRARSGFALEVAFDAGDGVTAIYGPSGSGKSTTLAVIAGIVTPACGRITLGDRVLLDTAASVSAPAEERRVGMVFQDHLLFPHLTVRENLRFGLARRPARRIDIERVVEILELGDVLERYPRTLSGGQRQRTALGRALIRGPELLLMDEPLSALDAELKHRILSYLERAFGEYGMPTLFVSHDRSDVRRLAERVVVLAGGRVTRVGAVSEVFDRASEPLPGDVRGDALP